MFNKEKSISDLQQILLRSKLSICAEEANYPSAHLPYIRNCIEQFVSALTEYEQGYVSNLSKKELEDLIALIQEPTVLAFLISHQLDLHWIFGHQFVLKGESRAISNRIKRYNAPWGKETTLSLTKLLCTPPISQFVENSMISFRDLRQWDKGNELGMDFVNSVLMYLFQYATEIQSQLDNKTLNKASLHQHFLDQGKEGLSQLNIQRNV